MGLLAQVLELLCADWCALFPFKVNVLVGILLDVQLIVIVSQSPRVTRFVLGRKSGHITIGLSFFLGCRHM
jgi:hypothetical protein